MNTNIASIYKSAAGKEEIMALYDRVLERWTVPYETLRVPTRHGNTFIIASGEKTAPALVLLHGSTSNATSWVADVAEYNRAGNTVPVVLTHFSLYDLCKTM